MADWAKAKIEDVRRGNVVEVENSMGEVLTVSTVRTLGPKLGHIELYLKEFGPVSVPPGTVVDVFR